MHSVERLPSAPRQGCLEGESVLSPLRIFGDISECSHVIFRFIKVVGEKNERKKCRLKNSQRVRICVGQVCVVPGPELGELGSSGCLTAAYRDTRAWASGVEFAAQLCFL